MTAAATAMNKYWVVLVTRIKEDLAYRVNYLVGAVLRFLPMVTTVFLWYAVYHSGPSGGGTKAGMTFHDVVAYYLLVYISRGFSSMPGMSQEISREIKDGQLNRYLVRPIRYFWYQVMFRMAHKVVFWMVALVTFPPMFWLFRGFFTHSPDAVEWTAFVLLLALGFGVGVLFSFLLGSLAFWFLEISTFLFIVMGIELFFSGQMIPLNFLPEAVQRAVLYLPFAYEAYWPCAIILGKVPGGEIPAILGVGVLWILVLYGLCQAVWGLGLRRYSAVGG